MIRFHEHEGRYTLAFNVGQFGDVDDAVFETGHEPNGYFWEGFVRFSWPGLADAVDLDSEGSEFVAYGNDKPALVQLKIMFEEALTNPEYVRDIISRATAAGFDFDD